MHRLSRATRLWSVALRSGVLHGRRPPGAELCPHCHEPLTTDHVLTLHRDETEPELCRLLETVES